MDDPAAPFSAKDYSECSAYQRQWNDLFNRVDRMHEDCLDKHRRAGDKANPEANYGAVCSFSACQALHTRKREIDLRMGPAVEQCRSQVGQYLEGERRRKEAEERTRLENERRRQEYERAVADSNIRAAEQAEARSRAADAEKQRIINAANERIARYERQANAINNAIGSIYDSIMARNRESAAEREADRKAERAESEARAEREEMTRMNRERQAYEEETRRAAEESARHAAQESARRAEGEYTRNIVESDIADRGGTEANNNREPDLDSQILAQMQLNVSDADSIFGSDARSSISDIDLSTNAFVPGLTTMDSYALIEPSSSSSFLDIFRKLPTIDPLVDALKEKILDVREELPDSLVDNVLEKLGGNEEAENFPDFGGFLKDKVQTYVVDKLWERSIERVQEPLRSDASHPRG